MTVTPPALVRANPDLSAIAPHPSKAISEAVADRADVIDLSVGLPAFGTPPALRAALGRRLLDATADRQPFDVYAPSRGVARTRAAVADWYRREHDLDVDPDHVLITHGAAEALWLTVFALTAAGDDVLVPDPSYPLYEAVVASLGRRAVRVPTGEDFTVDPDALCAAATPRSSLVIVNSPANPTGATLTAGDMDAIVRAMAGRGITVVHDEALGAFAAEVPHVPARRCLSGSGVVLVNSVSKSMGATGWRLGWAVGPQPAIDLMAKAHTYLTLAVNGAVQEAMADVLASADMSVLVRRRAAEAASRRAALHAALRANPRFEVPDRVPGGGLYLFPSVAPLAARLGAGDDAGAEVAAHLLDRCGVAVVPGSAFGPSGRSHVRVSAAADDATLAEAARRLEEA